MLGISLDSRVTELIKIAIGREENARWGFVEAKTLSASPATKNLDPRLAQNVCFSETKPRIRGTEVDGHRDRTFSIFHFSCVKAVWRLLWREPFSKQLNDPVHSLWHDSRESN